MIDFEREKLLVIRDKKGHDTEVWKVPGGLVDCGESLADASEREVLEETGKNYLTIKANLSGIKCDFKGVIGMREKHPYYFNRNDLYIFCLLTPLTHEIVPC